jgi:hypothetical protein
MGAVQHNTQRRTEDMNETYATTVVKLATDLQFASPSMLGSQANLPQ